MQPEADAQSLRGVLETERECCARLLGVLDAERTAAAAYDHAALLACLKERESIQVEWQRAAAIRRQRLGRSDAAVVLAALDPELAAIADGVREQAVAVRRAQRVNEGLIRTVLTHVTDLLTAIRRELPESRYDGHATLMGPLPSSSGSWKV
jgi:hypothetical protein